MLKSIKSSAIRGIGPLERDLQTALYSMKKLYEWIGSFYNFYEVWSPWSLLLMLSSYTPDDDVAPVIIKMTNFSENT